MEYLSMVKKCGASEAGYIDTEGIVLHDEVRKYCEGNVCRYYNRTWACPPAIGSIDECRKRIKDYDRLLLYSRIYEIEDSYDFDGMHKAALAFKLLANNIQDTITGDDVKCLFLANEGCGRCKTCTYPDEPCRFPKLLQHSIEGYGFMISDLARMAGMNYMNGNNTVTFFGGILF